MSKQNTKINLENLTVEDGGILYDMEDLSRLSRIYDRLCLADYIIFEKKDVTKEEAYKIACLVREAVEDSCDCESRILDYNFDDFLKEVRED